MGEIEEIVNLVAANTIAHGDVEYDADAVAELYEALVEKAVDEFPAIILKDITGEVFNRSETAQTSATRCRAKTLEALGKTSPVA